MRKHRDPLVFKGISAIDMAGGVDGFVRELLAEATREGARIVREYGVFQDEEQLEYMQSKVVTDAMFRRLRDDLNAGFAERMEHAVRMCGGLIGVMAARRQAFENAKAWSLAVTNEILYRVEYEYTEVFDAIGRDESNPHSIG